MYCIVLYAFKSLYCTIVLNKLVNGDLSRFFWLSCLCPLVLLVPKHFYIILLSNLSILNVTDEGYSRNASCALNNISAFL